jgi:hypothetical protein
MASGRVTFTCREMHYPDRVVNADLEYLFLIRPTNLTRSLIRHHSSINSVSNADYKWEKIDKRPLQLIILLYKNYRVIIPILIVIKFLLLRS